MLRRLYLIALVDAFSVLARLSKKSPPLNASGRPARASSDALVPVDDVEQGLRQPGETGPAMEAGASVV